MADHPKCNVFEAISDPTRRSLLKLLADREMSIAEIVTFYPLSRTAINKHLHVLSGADLVRSQKAGRETRYKLHPEPLVELKDWLTFFEQYWDKKLFALKDYIEKNEDQ